MALLFSSQAMHITSSSSIKTKQSVWLKPPGHLGFNFSSSASLSYLRCKNRSRCILMQVAGPQVTNLVETELMSEKETASDGRWIHGDSRSTMITSFMPHIIKIEQFINAFLTESEAIIIEAFYRDRHYARFYVLETIARIPYFAFMSVLHMYETFGWQRKTDYLKIHFAESWNELHHLLIMEELGGNTMWFDRLFAQVTSLIYFFTTAFMYVLSPRMAYHFSECIERHAYATYDKFINLHEEELRKLPPPEIAIRYYMGSDFYLFDEFHTGSDQLRRPIIENLYDVFINIRDDEAEHCKTMGACQVHGALGSHPGPHVNTKSL